MIPSPALNFRQRPLEYFRGNLVCRVTAAIILVWVGQDGVARARGPEDASRIETVDQLSPATRAEVTSQIDFHVGHPELGEINLVNRQAVPKILTFQTDHSFSFTSNAFLRPHDEKESFLWNGRFAATLVPYSTRNFTPSITFEQNFFRYSSVSELDFDTQTVTAAAKIDLTKDERWSTTTAYSLTRLYTPRFDTGEFYKFGLLSESITYIRQLGQSPVFSGATLGGNWRHGQPSTFDRFGIFLNLAAIYTPIDSIQVAAFIRPEVHFFTNHDSDNPHHGEDRQNRPKEPTDFNLTGGLSVTWTPIKYFAISANVLWTGNWSTYSPHEYEAFTPSIALSASIAF